MALQGCQLLAAAAVAGRRCRRHRCVRRIHSALKSSWLPELLLTVYAQRASPMRFVTPGATLCKFW